MASLKGRYGLPARPSEGLQARRNGGIPAKSTSNVREEVGLQSATTTRTTQSRLPSRVPQPSSTQRPSIPQNSSIPTANRQSRSWGSSSTAASEGSKTHTQNGSGSSSSATSYESNLHARNTLRRKKPSISRESSRRTEDSNDVFVNAKLQTKSPSEPPVWYSSRALTESPKEIPAINYQSSSQDTTRSPVKYPELDRYRNHQHPALDHGAQREETNAHLPFRLATHDLPPPTPGSILFSASSSQLSAVSASPSTKFSGSPGPGPYSRDTTPTSISSQSPSMVSSSRFMSPKLRQHSPALTRPPVTRRRGSSISEDVNTTSVDPRGLAAVRESLTSSSSSSTVRDGERNTRQRDKKTMRLPPPPPSPPPRKSSQNPRLVKKDTSPSPTIEDAAISQVLPSPSTIAPSQRIKSPVKPETPRRPSRDGTPDMHSQVFGSIPIVHSNLSTSFIPYERRGSEPTIPTSISKPSVPSSLPTKNASASNLPITQITQPRGRTTVAVPPVLKVDVPADPRPSRTPSPKVGSSLGSRFAFFSRKKTAPSKEQEESKAAKKSARKGPAAGTGHEGYGKLGATRRRSGSTANFTRGLPQTQSSQESLVSNDSFFTDRMNPVVITGGAVVDNRNMSSDLARVESHDSILAGRPSTDSDCSQAGDRTTMWPSVFPLSRPVISGSRRPSDSSGSDVLEVRPTLAARRSIHRLRSSPDAPLRLPQPINTSGSAHSPITSFDTSVMSDDSFFEVKHDAGRGRSVAHPTPKKLVKRERSPRKWNIFSRSRGTSATREKEGPVAAKVQSVEKKPVAYYAMMDSEEQDDSDVVDIREVLRNADVYTHSPNLASSTPDTTHSATMPSLTVPPLFTRERQGSFSSIDKSIVPLQVASPPQLPKPAPEMLSSGRPSRLPQVGRIPKVVSNRPPQASPKSFSRPFRRSVVQPAVALEPAKNAPVPSEEETSATQGLLQRSDNSESVSYIIANVSPAPEPVAVQTTASPEALAIHKEFLRFSPRKNSQSTVGTHSSSSGVTSFAEATAVVPQPNDPPAEDEIWDEYDDLLGDDDMRPPLSATSSKGRPFHLDSRRSRLAAKDKPMESPTIVMDTRNSHAPTISSTYSADMTERIGKAFQPHPSPTVPLPSASAGTIVRRDDSPGARTERGNRSNRSSACSCTTPVSDSSSFDDSLPLAQVNLRVGSMTVSKWLTFGHVLFSDVRHELLLEESTQKRHSILVIDGLGNDDWSFYAAETYSSATFYNLSPRAPLPAELQNTVSSFPLSPPNHHQIQYLSHLEKFPFAPQSFTSMVYRFPPAAPASHYRNVLTEARRVLKPGGYLELSILDADLHNVGTRGRRAVRRLKEQIHEQMQSTSLASTADLLIRELGQAGFISIKAARVGVPVASPIAKGAESSTVTSLKEKKQRKKDPPSLAEMMSKDGAKADEGITKMVARVGRWWYTRCYESTVAGESHDSIWDNKALLKECEEFGTTLKLTVCCARAPDRVTSV